MSNVKPMSSYPENQADHGSLATIGYVNDAIADSEAGGTISAANVTTSDGSNVQAKLTDLEARVAALETP